MLELLSYMAESEREWTNGRQAEGIAAAKNDGVVFGRPKQAINEEFKQATPNGNMEGLQQLPQ